MEAKFKIDEIVGLKANDWIQSWQNYIKTRIDEQSLKRDSNNHLQSLLKAFYEKANHKIIGIRRKIDFVDPRDRYNRKIVDGYEYLLEKKVLATTVEEWIDEDLICQVSDKLQEMMIFSDFLNEGIKRFIEEINGPIVEKKVVDENDDLEIELEL